MKLLLLSLLCVSIPLYAAQSKINKVVVSGVGEVNFKPDLAIVNFGVRTQEKTALLAQTENSKITNKVLKMLRVKFLIKDEEIQTRSFNVSPHIQYLKNGKRKIDGYVVQNRFSLKFRKIDKLGKLLDKLTQNGINDIGTINFSTDRHFHYEKLAMKMAVVNAKEKASLLVKETGRKLGRVVRIIQGNVPDQRPMPEMGMAKSMMASTPVMSGQVSVSTNVIITYELK